MASMERFLGVEASLMVLIIFGGMGAIFEVAGLWRNRERLHHRLLLPSYMCRDQWNTGSSSRPLGAYITVNSIFATTNHLQEIS